MKLNNKKRRKVSRLDRIEIAILDLALAVEGGKWINIYQNTAVTLFPKPKRVKK